MVATLVSYALYHRLYLQYCSWNEKLKKIQHLYTNENKEYLQQRLNYKYNTPVSWNQSHRIKPIIWLTSLSYEWSELFHILLNIGKTWPSYIYCHTHSLRSSKRSESMSWSQPLPIQGQYKGKDYFLCNMPIINVFDKFSFVWHLY